MRILNERPCDDVLFDVDLTTEERELLIDYACQNMPLEDVDEMLINWAIVNILKKQIERGESLEECDDEYF